ncbi:AraC-like DNA-binding protein [Novosphingobium hassiacum]|uniref:AraC-like DNA-binding protein n=1 Tax=Novosphingobium hassiacum TaxID=173676 RepID=A0A7W5ZZ48_9SPHN|nr:AraC family transcriptional regulator [Novosphingobium hassiacum]MBB3862181.1 AraC-like DNA-binding protein [Novosphingobium hassiacum]
MEKLFAGFSGNAPTVVSSYEAITRREFYDGELISETGDFSGVDLEKALSSPLSITRITTRTELSFRRGPQHIRKNRVGLRVLWFALTGSIRIVRATGTTEIPAGKAGFLDSSVPFSASLKRSPDGHHSSYQVIIPPDLFMSHLHEAERLTEPFSLDTREGHAVRELLEVLAKYGDRLGEKTAELMSHSLLEATADHLRNSGIEMPRRQKLVDRRLSDIENYIKMNLADPELSYDKVAISCGISPRYLCFLLKANNTSFSELVWKNRMPKARDWLISPKTRDYPIHEIAYMSGFKSAAHFSRMFKATYGMPPREYRAQNSGDGQLANHSAHEFVRFTHVENRQAA